VAGPARRAAQRAVAVGGRDHLGDAGDHVGAGHRRPDRGLRGRPPRQGRDGLRGDGPGGRHAGALHARHGAGPGRRPRRHRRRPGAHGQHLHHGCDRRRGRGRADGQARQPGRVLLLWRRRPARGARRRDQPVPRGDGRGRGRGRHHVLLRAAVPPGAEVRLAYAKRARHPHGVQLPGPADQPGPADRPGGGRLPPAHGRGHGGRLRRTRLLLAGVPRRRRPGRADHDLHVGHLGGPRRHRHRDRLRPGRAGHPPSDAGGAARRGRPVQRPGGAGRPGR